MMISYSISRGPDRLKISSFLLTQLWCEARSKAEIAINMDIRRTLGDSGCPPRAKREASIGYFSVPHDAKLPRTFLSSK